MLTYYKLGSHVLELEPRPCVLGVLRPIVIKWLKPGWLDAWDMAKVLTGAYGPGSPGRIPTISSLNHQCVR